MGEGMGEQEMEEPVATSCGNFLKLRFTEIAFVNQLMKIFT